jgi:hypothetical protein
MPKLTVSSVISSVVSLLLVTAIVAVGVFATSQRLSTVAYAAEDSGVACNTSAECVASGNGNSCMNGTCVLAGPGAAVPKAATKQIQDLDDANKSEKESVFKLTDTINNASLASITKLLAGCTTGACTDYNGEPTETAGLYGGLTSTMVAMFNTQPANSTTAIADALDSAGIVVQPAHAQGIGFAALDPILDTWKVFRNLAYLFFILTFVVIGFMIMFRQKVGQAAVTAQQAIPQIIIALVTVTFSYAIAGLLIDLMYLLMYLIVGIFGEESSLIDLNVFTLGFQMLTRSWTNIGAIGGFVDATLSSFTRVVSYSLGVIANGAFLLIITVAILIGMFRLFFELLKTYVTIVISIALAPLILMLGAIPGRSSFGGWVQSLVGNLAAFPTVLLVLIIFDMISGAEGINNAGFLPPYLLGGGAGGVIPTLVGLGMILALPEIVVKVKEALGAKDTFGWLTSAAFKNMDRGQAAIPLTTKYGAGLGSMIANQGILRDQSMSPEDRRKNYWKEVDAAKDKGWDVGKSTLKWYQRIREGRLTQVEDIESLLSSIRQQQGGGNTGGGSSNHK